MSENRWKIHIRRILRSPLASCKSKDQVSDVVETNHHHGGGRRCQLVELFSPAQLRSPFIFRSPAAAAAEEDQTYFITNKINTSLLRNKLPLLLSPVNVNGRKCPPASPIISPLNNSFYEFPKQKKKAVTKKKGRSIIAYNKNKCNGFFISDNDEEEEEEEEEGEDDRAKLFWRRSSTSTTATAAARRRMDAETAAADDTLAVVKRSSDPYSDFRTSMVEMIVEKEIFATKDLQNLLHCFLSLNSCRHHKVIFQVFAEIWEALLLS